MKKIKMSSAKYKQFLDFYNFIKTINNGNGFTNYDVVNSFPLIAPELRTVEFNELFNSFDPEHPSDYIEVLDLETNDINKIINSTTQDIYCDVSGFTHKLVDPEQEVIGFSTVVQQQISNYIADLDNFTENFIKNTPDYRDYHLETRYKTVIPPEGKSDNFPDVYESQVVVEFVKNDKEEIKDEFY